MKDSRATGCQASSYMRVVSVFIFTILLLIGCSEGLPPGYDVPAEVPKHLGDGPWQVISYEGESIIKEVVELQDGQFFTLKRSVYLDDRSRFVFKDGNPILSPRGLEMYWNENGNIIDENLNLVYEDEVFVVSGKPLSIGAALTYKATVVHAKNN